MLIKWDKNIWLYHCFHLPAHWNPTPCVSSPEAFSLFHPLTRVLPTLEDQRIWGFHCGRTGGECGEKRRWTKAKRGMNCWRRFQEPKGQILKRKQKKLFLKNRFLRNIFGLLIPSQCLRKPSERLIALKWLLIAWTVLFCLWHHSGSDLCGSWIYRFKLASPAAVHRKHCVTKVYKNQLL